MVAKYAAQANRLIGYSLVVMLCGTLIASLGFASFLWLAAVAAWFAAIQLFPRLAKLQTVQVTLMLVFGLVGLLYAQVNQAAQQAWQAAATNNLSLLSMLMSVSFLRLVAMHDLSVQEDLPKGRLALFKTLLGVHFFGAVINFSVLVIMADRLAAKGRLSPLQALVITRGFTLAAHWSPFFASMGVVLISAPGASLWKILPLGFGLAVCGLLWAAFTLLRRPEAKETYAYPMHWRALGLPAFLALSVLVLHLIFPQVAILTLVSGSALAVTLGLLIYRHGWLALKYLRQHVEITLPSMAGETLLFLAAGVLAAGLGAAFTATGLVVEIDYFGVWQAWLLLIILVSVSVLGIHPVITISTASGLLVPWVSDPNLLALIFLMTWALGVSLSPLSGTHLAMQGRYNLPSYAFTRWNAGYIAVLLVVQLAGLQMYFYLNA